MENLLSLHFWFNIRPPQLTPLFQYSLITFIILLAAGCGFFFWKKRKKGKSKNFYITAWRKLYYFCGTNLILGLLLLLFNYEKTPFFSARFWYLVWLAEMLVWLFFIYKFLKTVPEKIKKAEQEENYKKYLPQ